jgi:hypothetical protein
MGFDEVAFILVTRKYKTAASRNEMRGKTMKNLNKKG